MSRVAVRNRPRMRCGRGRRLIQVLIVGGALFHGLHIGWASSDADDRADAVHYARICEAPRIALANLERAVFLNPSRENRRDAAERVVAIAERLLETYPSDSAAELCVDEIVRRWGRFATKAQLRSVLTPERCRENSVVQREDARTAICAGLVHSATYAARLERGCSLFWKYRGRRDARYYSAVADYMITSEFRCVRDPRDWNPYVIAEAAASYGVLQEQHRIAECPCMSPPPTRTPDGRDIILLPKAATIGRGFNGRRCQLLGRVASLQRDLMPMGVHRSRLVTGDLPGPDDSSSDEEIYRWLLHEVHGGAEKATWEHFPYERRLYEAEYRAMFGLGRERLSGEGDRAMRRYVGGRWRETDLSAPGPVAEAVRRAFEEPRGDSSVTQ